MDKAAPTRPNQYRKRPQRRPRWIAEQFALLPVLEENPLRDARPSDLKAAEDLDPKFHTTPARKIPINGEYRVVHRRLLRLLAEHGPMDIYTAIRSVGYDQDVAFFALEQLAGEVNGEVSHVGREVAITDKGREVIR